MAKATSPSVFMYMNYLEFLKDLESYLEVHHQLTKSEIARMRLSSARKSAARLLLSNG